MDREEQLFKRLERRIVAARIGSGVGASDDADVEGFLAFSLSVQNRRKARAGQALENHLEAVLRHRAFSMSAAQRRKTETNMISCFQAKSSIGIRSIRKHD